MSKEEILNKITEAVVQFDIDNIQNLVKEALDKGIPPVEIITSGMAKGMEIVGNKYESKEYFLAELIMAGKL